MSIAHPIGGADFAYDEWHRLSGLSSRYEAALRLAFTTMIARNGDARPIEDTMTRLVVQVAESSASQYGLAFDPTNVRWGNLIVELTDRFVDAYTATDAKAAVARVLPRNVQGLDRTKRLNAAVGLAPTTAVALEMQWQKKSTTEAGRRQVTTERRAALQSRANLFAVTETNRAVNQTLETLWLSNTSISKAADSVTYYETNVVPLHRVPLTAKKEWITRRDNRVCPYCDPLDGETAKIGEDFDTARGLYQYPPIHPHCRCFIILSRR